ncbi:hypothetical protein DFH27DRAFT_520747 [Peziza echinospora]|nr:hypothetical protein DFH27DRAFT_520747 [Peziza echinospora]
MFIPLATADPLSLESSSGYHTLLQARKIGALGRIRPGRATTGLGTGVAIGLIGAFILGFFVRYFIRDRMARKGAKAHVSALAAEDRALWGSRRARGGSPTGARPGLPVYTPPSDTPTLSDDDYLEIGGWLHMLGGTGALGGLGLGSRHCMPYGGNGGLEEDRLRTEGDGRELGFARAPKLKVAELGFKAAMSARPVSSV